MDRKNEIIHTNPPVGWDISTINAYDAMMIRLHYVNSPDQATADAVVDRTLRITTYIVKQLFPFSNPVSPK